MAKKEFTVYRTQHGPVVRELNGKWVAIRIMQEPLKALTQSYSRTKAKNYKAFRQTMELHTNSSNNTIFADADGNIAYFHANFIPKRDTKFDWTKPVDGSDPATEWKGLLSVDESPHLLNPASGWLYNTNNWPWTAAGPSSPKKADYPEYVENGRENRARRARDPRAQRTRRTSRSSRSITAAYDSYLPAFAELIPPLVKAYDEAPAGAPLKTKVADQIELLREWDCRWSVDVGADVARRVLGRRARGATPSARRAPTPDQRRSLAGVGDGVATSSRRTSATWKTPWGDINRFQRLTGDIVQPFNDAGRASRSASRRRAGVRSRRSGHAPTRARRSGTARAATASSRSWSSATACARER